MPNEKTHADAVRTYLTGAASDGGVQTSPNLSLGNFRSASELLHLVVAITSPIAQLTVDFVSGANGVGAGTLTATGASTLTWTAPGGAAGAAVTIANGETKIVEGNAAPEKYVRVTRISASAMSGAATITLTENPSSLIGFDDVSSAEAAAGDTEYRAYMLKNVAPSQVKTLKVWLSRLGTAAVVNAAGYGAAGAVTITAKAGSDFDDWPGSATAGGFVENENTGEVLYYSSRTDAALTVPAAGRDVWADAIAAGLENHVLVPVPGLRIAKEAPSAQPTGYIQTIGTEAVAPAGLTWVHPHIVSDAEVLTIGDLDSLNVYGVWLQRRVTVGAIAVTAVAQRLEWSFETAV
jgi:hypothetical protein